MCGRYVSPEEAEIERAWEIGRRNNNPFAKRYNTAPSTQVPVLLGEAAGLTLKQARWGLIPHWWKEVQPPRATINARIEGVAQKPMWRHAFAKSRCLVPACGWYEWTQGESIDPETGEVRPVKQPHYLYRPDVPVLAFAGLLAHRKDEAGEDQISMAIITRQAEGPAAEVHDRMPVIIDSDAQGEWLSADVTDPKGLLALLEAQLGSDVSHYPVSRRVNSPRNDDAGLLEPLPGAG